MKNGDPRGLRVLGLFAAQFIWFLGYISAKLYVHFKEPFFNPATWLILIFVCFLYLNIWQDIIRLWKTRTFKRGRIRNAYVNVTRAIHKKEGIIWLLFVVASSFLTYVYRPVLIVNFQLAFLLLLLTGFKYYTAHLYNMIYGIDKK